MTGLPGEVLAIVAPSGGTPNDVSSLAVLVTVVGLVVLSLAVSFYADHVGTEHALLEKALAEFPSSLPKKVSSIRPPELSREKTTAILLVEGYDAAGVHALCDAAGIFPGGLSQVVILTIRGFDMTDAERQEEARRLRTHLERSLRQYMPIAELLELRGDVRVVLDPDPLAAAAQACWAVARHCPKLVFFWARPAISPPKWHHRWMGDRTVQRLAQELFRSGWITVELELPVHVNSGRRRDSLRVAG